jgi:Domain of unknown function (DUF1851)
MATWSQITIQPSDAAVESLREHWRWQLGDDWTPLLFSAIGDVFIEVAAGTVWWLSTATGSLEQVAESRQHFAEQLGGERTDEWFLPGLVDVLRSQGKVLGPEQCYTYAILPVFSQGSFSAENMHPVSAAEHFTMSGLIHESIRQLPDGAQAQVTVTD